MEEGRAAWAGDIRMGARDLVGDSLLRSISTSDMKQTPTTGSRNGPALDSHPSDTSSGLYNPPPPFVFESTRHV